MTKEKKLLKELWEELKEEVGKQYEKDFPVEGEEMEYDEYLECWCYKN